MASPSLTHTSSPSPIPSPIPTPMSIVPSSKPPVTPEPWRWKCHFCGHVYRLSCTRRCLSCSHRLCFSPDPRYSGNSKKLIICRTDFDFDSWGELSEWRRDTLEYKTNPYLWKAKTMELLGRLNKVRPHWSGGEKMGWIEDRRKNTRRMKRISRFNDKTHDCTVDCSYPSECIREFWAAQLVEQRETSTQDDSSDDDSSDDDSSDDEEATSTSNQEMPSCSLSQQGSSSSSGSLESYQGRPRRFRHIRWRRDTSGLNPLRQSSKAESPASPESP